MDGNDLFVAKKRDFLRGYHTTRLAGWSGLGLIALVLLSACAGVPTGSHPSEDSKSAESQPVIAEAKADIQLSPTDRAAVQTTAIFSVIQAPGSAFAFTSSPSGLTGTEVTLGILLSPTLFFPEERYKGYASSYVSNLKLVDPVPIVRRAFEQRLSSEIPVERLRMVDEPAVSDSIDALRTFVPNGVGIIVQTTAWQIQISRETWIARHRVVYSASAKAVQMPEGRIVWRATCRAITPEAINGRELYEDDGRLLKAKLAECASACADELWANYAGTTEESETPR